jgi:hypothetical protein
MAIREFSPEGTPRAKIAFVDGLPKAQDLDWFEKRNFECEPCTLEKLRQSDYAAVLDAVIWTQDPGKLNALPRELGPTVPNLLDYDVRVYVRLATDEKLTNTPRKLVVNALLESGIPVANLRPEEWQTIPESRRERENGFLMPCVYIFESASLWPDVATVVCDRPAGASPKFDLRFDENFLKDRFEPGGHGERAMLLKRAFWNCSELQLRLLDGGMSGAPVFKAYASLEAGLVQRSATGVAYPHLYFVKIGPRKKVVDEYDKYIWHISDYVPFHLRPRLRLDRCNLGSTQGILVGDFVEGTESLITCARGARSGHAISNLFDKTLGGWRKQKSPDTNQSLRSYLEKKWLVEGSDALIALPPARAEIVRDLGGETEVAPLKVIFENHGNTRVLIAPAHGDMHATNVLVRHGDAILIDFEKLEQHYPLTYDPASLEGGLLVEGFIEDLKNETFKPNDLVKLIEPLYEESAFKGRGMTLCPRGDPTEWYYDAVNQIRTLSWAAETEPGQYALTLALCLIRKGCNTHESLDAKAPSTSRAIAFFFGQKILRRIAEKTAGASGETITPAKVAE